jgi:hypothetical protein
MPKISTFYGIAIYMYYRDHVPPHCHAIYGGFDAEIDIDTGNILVGNLPKRAARLVRQWVLLHRDELTDDWLRADRGDPLVPIPPLD